MNQVPEKFRYTRSHEWAEPLDDGTVRVGITDHAQDLLGDMVYVELPAVGASVRQGEECGVVESVKAASDIYTPISGEIVAVNEALGEKPELINQSPHAEGWIFRIKPSDRTEIDDLLSATDYEAFAKSSGD